MLKDSQKRPSVAVARGCQGHMTAAVGSEKEHRPATTTPACETLQPFLKRDVLLRPSMSGRECVPPPKPDCGTVT